MDSAEVDWREIMKGKVELHYIALIHARNKLTTDHMYFPHEIRAKMIIMSAKLSLIHLCLRFKTIGLIETTLCQLMHKLGGNVAVLFSLNCCNTI
ncbi:hypothetical protein AAZV13_06G120800 [Glycine max]